jgi:7-cyano-7-deazaguanine synthase
MKNIIKELQKTMSITRRNVVCTLSGGLDSAVAAAIMYKLGFKLNFIFFDWGQKTYKKELLCAKLLSKYFRANLKIVTIPLLKSLPGISLTQTETLTTAVNEYVPNRNAILETQAVAYAEYLKAGAVCIGSTGGDHICPDNSPQFIAAMQLLVKEGTLLKPPILIVAPLIKTNKTGAVRLGLEIGVPFKFTWSCHNKIDIACGRCSNCISRVEAFRNNGAIDPIRYEK